MARAGDICQVPLASGQERPDDGLHEPGMEHEGRRQRDPCKHRRPQNSVRLAAASGATNRRSQSKPAFRHKAARRPKSPKWSTKLSDTRAQTWTCTPRTAGMTGLHDRIRLPPCRPRRSRGLGRSRVRSTARPTLPSRPRRFRQGCPWSRWRTGVRPAIYSSSSSPIGRFFGPGCPGRCPVSDGLRVGLVCLPACVSLGGLAMPKARRPTVKPPSDRAPHVRWTPMALRTGPSACFRSTGRRATFPLAATTDGCPLELKPKPYPLPARFLVRDGSTCQALRPRPRTPPLAWRSSPRGIFHERHHP